MRMVRHGFVGGTVLMLAVALGQGVLEAGEATVPGRWIVPVQVPFELPPKPEEVPDVSVPPSNEPLSSEGIKRAEALLPMLSGKQELYAMGEFVHLGPPVVPVLAKALKMPDPRLRYNAIETMNMIKHPSAVPALLETATESNEMSRVREHALRVAVRLSPLKTTAAIVSMAKDSNSTIRKAAAFEARYVRDKAVVPILIELISDSERFVSITAVQSLWRLTEHPTELHDWETSTLQDRQEWVKEWRRWWREAEDTFQFPDRNRGRQPS